ncbi:MAG: FKBP-type peptidyl-prolyl cis-trans isomerase [Bacteroidetes bacterium]|nr:FKBP-type peptidyl-prolyl cis-trans isomerase [Bacteroidota bacterium]
MPFNSKATVIITITFFLSCFLFACKNIPDYPGYIKTDSGIHFQLLQIGEGVERDFVPGEYYTADIIYSTLEDSVFFTGRRKVQIFEPEFPGSIEECFSMLQVGDSAVFIISANDFFNRTLGTGIPSFLPDGRDMKVVLRILEIQTVEQYAKEKEAFLSWIRDFEEFEHVNLKQFIQDENLGVTPTPSGMYVINIQEGNGKKIEYGDTITINYEGWFLNGKFFDSTKERQDPFTFVYGTEWQVIRGIEEALGRMCEGERTIFIMPSRMAFGYTGSSTGIIPPFTSVIFEIEVLKVLNNDTIRSL